MEERTLSTTLVENLMKASKQDLIKAANVVGAKIKKTWSKVEIAKATSNFNPR